MAVLLTASFLVANPAAGLAKPAPGDFIDIKGHRYQQAILEVYNRGLMQGTGSNAQGFRIFAPEVVATRAQAASVLARTFRLDYGKMRFIKQPLPSDYYRDINNQAWYAEAALLCAINEIFASSVYFYPDRPITRIEMARAIKNCFDVKGISIPMIMVMPVYQDTDDLSPQDMNAVAFVTNTGIMKGDGRYFRPADAVKRAELAQIIANALSVMESQVDVDENYNGKEYPVAPGRTFVLSLPANNSTGYQWDFTSPYDKKVLAQTDHYYRADKNAGSPLPGQGGRSYWRFEALQVGSTELCLAYSRPWEKNAPAQTFKLKVAVTPAADSEQRIPLITKKLKEQSETLGVDMEIPAIDVLEDKDIQSSLNSRWETEAMAFKQEIAAELEQYVKACKEQGYPIRPYEVVTRYQECSNSEGYLSLYVDYYGYTGGAHGFTERRAYNLDLNTGKDLALKDLFRDGFDYKAVLNQVIREQIAAAPGDYFDQPGMGFTTIADDQSYYIADGNLVIYFGLYEIAPYAAGIPEFKIPLSDLKDGLRVQLLQQSNH